MRPHSNDDIRWVELFYIAGIVYETPTYETTTPESSTEMTVDEFMEYMKRRLK